MVTTTDLALAAAQAIRQDETRSDAARRAVAELAPRITGLARAVCARNGRLRLQDARDFVDGAAAHVWVKLPKFERWYLTKLEPESKANPGADFFTAWCRRVLENHCRDCGRRIARAIVHQELKGAESCDRRHDVRSEASNLQLSSEQIERVQRWDPVDGVIAFGLSGSWSLLPPTLGGRWLATLNMPGSFPAELLSTPRARRRELLATALRIRRNTLDKRWSRFASSHGVRCRAGSAAVSAA